MLDSVILQGVVGSTAYGLDTPDSDQDMLGVFCAPTIELLGLHGHTLTTQTITTENPDSALHELGKFASLALRCNPTVLEILYLTEYTTITPAGQELVIARDAFLSESAVRNAYAGYAVAQAQKIATREPGARTQKHARHCARLLLQGAQLLTTGVITMDVSSHRDVIFSLGDLALSDPAAFAKHFEVTLESFNNLQSVLPRFPDQQRIETLVRNIRLHSLKQ